MVLRGEFLRLGLTDSQKRTDTKSHSRADALLILLPTWRLPQPQTLLAWCHNGHAELPRSVLGTSAGAGREEPQFLMAATQRGCARGPAQG